MRYHQQLQGLEETRGARHDTAFVLQIPNSDGHFVHTWRDMQTLAPGVYEAELVQKVRLPQKIARGCDAWKCV